MFKLLAAIAIVAVAHPAAAQAHREQNIHVTVVDRSGAPATSVDADDFVITEDGVRREVLQVARATDPLRVTVLVDTSQAATPHVSDIRSALRSFVRAMNEQHEIALIGFGERPTTFTDFTRDRRRLDEAIGRVFGYPGTGSYLLDAIKEVADDLRTRDDRRSAIIVVTTEGPEFSLRDYGTMLERLRIAGSTLHAFVMPRNGARFRSSADRERELTLSKGVHMTGGRREDLLTSMALTDRLQELAAEFDSQYRVVYARPDSMLEPRTVRVKMTSPGLMARARRVAGSSR